MLVKCATCGKQYDIERESNISDFQCECGGELVRKRVETHTTESSTHIGTIPIVSGNMGNKTSDKSKKKKEESKLISCPDCGHKVSKKAKNCPNCGRQFRRDLTSIEIVGGIILLIILIPIFLFFGLAALGSTMKGFGNLINNPIIFYPILFMGLFLILRSAYQKKSWSTLAAYLFWFIVGLTFLGILLGPWD